jgi:methyltransferase (TIGR00027 family)
MGKSMSGIKDVSDTALWVAVHRACEGARPDALYKDPLSLKLAGPRGEQIAKKMAGGDFMSWMMAMRTVAIDNMIISAVNSGITRIVNLGVGLDTRPYRLKLSQRVSWLEVDFPGLIDHKNKLLKSEMPLLPLKRVGVNLTDLNERQRFFDELNATNEPTLILTEGVLPYLSNPDVESLAKSLHQLSCVKYWVHDYRQGGYASGIPKIWIMWRMRHAQMVFKVENWFQYFAGLGWKVKESTTLKEESDRCGRSIGRPDWFGLLSFIIPPERMDAYSRQLGVVMLEKTI